LKSPQFETESIVYRYLIAGWVKVLGRKLPNGALPKEVRIENNKVYYTLPRNELQLLDSLFHNFENDSALMTTLKQGDLTIETSVVLSWNNFKLKNLLQLLIIHKSLVILFDTNHSRHRGHGGEEKGDC